MGKLNNGDLFPNSHRKKKKTWEKSEDRAASMVGGRKTKASGACQHDKGDAKSKNYLLECKSTDKKSIALKTEWLRKISGEATAKNKIPLMFLTFEDLGPERDWVMMPKTLFEEVFSESFDS